VVVLLENIEIPLVEFTEENITGTVNILGSGVHVACQDKLSIFFEMMFDP
jgi:hypothetical protein